VTQDQSQTPHDSADEDLLAVDNATATIDTFDPHIGSAFVFVPQDGAPVELQLLKTIDEYREAGSSSEFRRPFSLVFEAPDDTVHPQSNRKLQHTELGVVDVFLVPSGIFDGKVQYNVVFC
jgi:hypothetical protein